jgi:riboflavin kinase/FMN adenylyltransferase
MGMLSIGSNPTVNADIRIRSIEVHILNYNMDIYGRKISVTFRKRLRDEKKFDNIDQLTQQMELDKHDTLRVLS